MRKRNLLSWKEVALPLSVSGVSLTLRDLGHFYRSLSLGLSINFSSLSFIFSGLSAIFTRLSTFHSFCATPSTSIGHFARFIDHFVLAIDQFSRPIGHFARFIDQFVLSIDQFSQPIGHLHSAIYISLTAHNSHHFHRSLLLVSSITFSRLSINFTRLSINFPRLSIICTPLSTFHLLHMTKKLNRNLVEFLYLLI